MATYSLEATLHMTLVDACSQNPVSHLGVILGRGYGVFYLGSTGDNYNCQDVIDLGSQTVWSGEHSGCEEAPMSLVMFSPTTNTYDAQVDETIQSITLTCYENGVIVNETSVDDWLYSGCTMGTYGPVISPGASCSSYTF